MSAEFRKKWVEALRSGEYKQCELHWYDKNNHEYCCLGVANKISGETVSENGCLYGGDSIFNTTNQTGLNEEELASLATMNDCGTSFVKIADYIEETFKDRL